MIDCPKCRREMYSRIIKERKYKKGKVEIGIIMDVHGNVTKQAKIRKKHSPVTRYIRKWYCDNCGFAIKESGNLGERLRRYAHDKSNSRNVRMDEKNRR